jgi:DNA-binding transcriptional LysR family regulator
MELRHLRAFLAVAEELHFGRAAERLHMAQPPLSQQIRQLERHLGVALFDRNTRSVQLTSAGEALVEPAQRVLSDVDTAVRAARAGGRGEFGRVTLGFAGASSKAVLPVLARAVRESYPDIELVMQGQTYANAALARIADGTLDLGFIRLPFIAPGVEYQVVEDEELVVALPEGHRLASRPRLALADLANEPWVTFPADAGSSLQSLLQQVCLSAGFVPNVVQSAPDSYTIIALVAAHVGVTLTLTSVMRSIPDGVVYRPLSDDLPIVESAVAWNSQNPSTAVHSVIRVLQSRFARSTDLSFAKLTADIERGRSGIDQ